MDEPDLKLSPAWKQAVKEFLAAGFMAGDVVSHDWLGERFAIPRQDEEAMLTPAEFRDRQLRWLQAIESFKAELLELHQIYLASVPGEGYRWVPPHEQTGLAVAKFERAAKHAYRQVGDRLTHLRVGELTDEQRRENLDAVGRLTMLEGMHRALE